MLESDFERSLRESFASADVNDAIGLARIVASVGRARDVAPSIIRQLQSFLFDHTVRYCLQHVPFYGRLPLAQTLIAGKIELSALRELPLLDRHTVQMNAEALTADNSRVQQVIHTSGSTGEPLQIFKSSVEIGFLQAFYGELIRTAIRPGDLRPLVLSLPNLYHGSAVPVPSIGLPLVSGVTDDTLLADAARLLVQEHRIPGFAPRISAISGLYFQVLFLTSYLQESGIDPATLGVSYINITGGFLSSYWLKYLKATWKCIVNDRYSLTEAVGGASRLGDAGVFQLDPVLIGEVIDIDQHKPVSEGVGELVLSSLYPLAQMQPLLRYRTGDLVRVVEGLDGRVQVFEFLGKQKNCVSEIDAAGVRKWLVFSATMMETLGPLPDVQYYDWFSNVRIARDRSVGSLPLYRFLPQENGGPDICVCIELRYSPHLYPERTETLRQAVLDGLRSDQRTGFAEWERARVRRAVVEFVGPGGIGSPPFIKV